MKSRTLRLTALARGQSRFRRLVRLSFDCLQELCRRQITVSFYVMDDQFWSSVDFIFRANDDHSTAFSLTLRPAQTSERSTKLTMVVTAMPYCWRECQVFELSQYSVRYTSLREIVFSVQPADVDRTGDRTGVGVWTQVWKVGHYCRTFLVNRAPRRFRKMVRWFHWGSAHTTSRISGSEASTW